MAAHTTCLAVLLLVTALGALVVGVSTDAPPSATPAKRGLAALTGVPGVLYSQFGQYPGGGGGPVRTVHVPHPYPVPVPHPVPVQVPRPFPVTVHKPVGLPVPVGVPVPVRVPVPKPYPVPVPVNLPQGPVPLGSFGGHPGDLASFGAFGGHPDLAGPFGGLGGHPGDLAGPFGPFAASGPGYGLGVYGHDAGSLPLTPPGLSGPPLSPSDLLAAHPPKY